ncbi:MAG: dTDP-4-dehydrorhamnose 3,5-epimerase [Balneolaceae bacterium]|nr:dTDP-4-dehydrorhamnose 3,5-epimerase [Balneolaceae bacterium]
MKGALYDVIVDLRSDSPTYKKWKGIELTAEDYTMFYVPEGCAHGYQTLKDGTEIFYMVSAFYAPDSEGGIRWDDPAFNIEWPETGDIIISGKDQSWPDYRD